KEKNRSKKCTPKQGRTAGLYLIPMFATRARTQRPHEKAPPLARRVTGAGTVLGNSRGLSTGSSEPYGGDRKMNDVGTESSWMRGGVTSGEVWEERAIESTCAEGQPDARTA